jgi:hypothetical protein
MVTTGTPTDIVIDKVVVHRCRPKKQHLLSSHSEKFLSSRHETHYHIPASDPTFRFGALSVLFQWAGKRRRSLWIRVFARL